MRRSQVPSHVGTVLYSGGSKDIVRDGTWTKQGASVCTTSARTDTDTRHFNIALQSRLPSHQRALPQPYNASTCRTVRQPQLMYLYHSVLYYVEQ